MSDFKTKKIAKLPCGTTIRIDRHKYFDTGKYFYDVAFVVQGIACIRKDHETNIGFEKYSYALEVFNSIVRNAS